MNPVKMKGPAQAKAAPPAKPQGPASPAEKRRGRYFSTVALAVRADRRLLYLFYGFLFFLVMTLAVTAWGAATYSTTSFESFWLSLMASFWEDLVFFLMLGSVAVLLTLNRPGDEGFENRVRYFFNGQHVTDGSRKHISDEMKRLGIFSPMYRACLTFNEHDGTLGAIKTTFQVDRTVVNMFKDQEFEAEEHSYTLGADDLPCEICGELLDLYRGQGGFERLHEPGTPKKFGRAGLQDSVTLKLSGDEAVHFGYRAWMWFKLGEAYSVRPSRYTEQVEVHVINESRVTLTLESEGNKDMVLTPGSERNYVCTKLAAGSTWIPFKLKGASA